MKPNRSSIALMIQADGNTKSRFGDRVAVPVLVLVSALEDPTNAR
jgi:hypothetical protein